MLRSTFVVAGRILTEFRRSRRALTLWVAFPAAMLVLFGWVGADELGRAEAFARTAPGILIGAGLFFSCLGGPVSVLVAERERRTLRRLLAAPLDGYAYLAGLVLAHLAVAAAQVVLVYGITYAVGGRFAGPILLGAAILALSVLAYVGLGVFFGTRIARSAEDANGAVAGIGVPLLVLGGTFFSSDRLPPVLYELAHLDPVFHMNEAFKGAASGLAGPSDLGWHVGLLAALALLAMVLGARSYNRLLDAERSA